MKASGVIPQTDPRAGYLAHRAEIDAAIATVLEGGAYVLGPEVAAFESELAAYAGAAQAVGVASGTDAIELALRACGVTEASRVFTVSFTAVPTVAAIVRAGATPVFVDIDAGTYAMDPASLEAALETFDARPGDAVLPVHLYGQMADLDAIGGLAASVGAVVVEDCAQAHGATLDGRRAGSIGVAGAFSFYPTKNLGALGDGGAVVTSDAAVAERLRGLRQYGWDAQRISQEDGLNSRLDELQAAVLRVKLRHLDEDNARRRAIAGLYDERLGGLPGVSPPVLRPGSTHVYHQYVVRTSRRPQFTAHLADRGVRTGIHYPVPAHLHPAYRDVPAGPSGLARSEAAAREVVSLPMFPELGVERATRVTEAIADWCKGGGQ